MHKPLPEFDNPPVVEVALSVQFESLTELRTPQLGLLWSKFRGRFPKLEEQAPLAPMRERFGVAGERKPRVQFEVLREAPVPRCWFLTDDGTELIQVQQDRFVRNWRKVGESGDYPRFDYIRSTFRKDFEEFERFARDEQIGEPHANQCEVTYVNHILAGSGSDNERDPSKILTVFETKYSEEFLPSLEEGRVSGAYVIPGTDGTPLGRLRFSIEPAFRHSDGQQILVLNLVARGQPDGKGMDGIMNFFDTGREWIVRGFAAITTPEMHKIWGRTR